MSLLGGHSSNRLSSRRLFLGGTLSIAITIIAASVAVWDLHGERIADETKNTKNLAVVLAEQTARAIQAVDLVVQETQGMVLAAGVTDADQFRLRMGTDEVHHILLERLHSLPQANSIALLDDAGVIVNFSRAWPVPVIDASDRDFYAYFREHNDPGAFIGVPIVNKVSGAWVVTLTRRISGPSGEFLGIVAGVVEARYFEDFYQAITTNEGETVSLFRRDGTLLARHPHLEGMIGKKISAESLWYGHVADGGTYRTPGYVGGVPRIVSVRPIREYPLAVTVGISEDVALAPWRRQSIMIAVSALGAVVGFVILFRALASQFRRLERQTSELVQTAEALRESEGRFRDFAMTSSDWFWEQDADLRFCRFSAVSNKPEIQWEFYLGKTRWEMADGGVTEDQWAAHKQALAARRPFRAFRYQRIRTNGEVRHLSTSGNPVFDEAGTFQGYRGTGTDITAEVEAEARLRESEERFRQLFEAASDWFWETDADLRITYVSENYEQITGRSTRSSLGKRRDENGDMTIDPEGWREHLAALEARRPFRDFVFQIKQTAPDERASWIKVSGVPVFGPDGRFRGYRGAASSVTAQVEAEVRRRELEVQLMHSQKLEALGTLAGGVAHDLNNTLVPILALSKLALDELPVGSGVHSDIETIIRASERARDLVKQILTFSRKQSVAKQQVDLAAVAREAMQMLRASLPATTRIVEQIREVPPLFGDVGELHQVVVNLVTNAAHAIGNRVGAITVGIWPVSGMGGSGPMVCLSVSDTGCGMDEATRNRVFEPFFTTKDVGSGTGLGLSVVHGIITSHSGKITVCSKPGEGTEFTISLPACDQHHTISQADLQPPE
jgi:PAS domain S-box-containing protein